jgi:hypothetical protein
LDAVGRLDERFEIGMFEDDDLSMRVRAAGYRVACADDVFVHHFGQASIGHLGATGQYGTLFHANRARWEEKWGRPWEAYEKRPRAEYLAVVDRVRQLVRDIVPPEATVAVLSKGDVQLLDLDGRPAWHFPQAADGSYAGFNPPDSEACIAHLEQLRVRGAEFLVIPEPARWWLDYYADFARDLDRRYHAIADAQSAATIIALHDPAA